MSFPQDLIMIVGYCFLLFQDEMSVQALIDACIVDDEKFYWCVSSPTMKDKPVSVTHSIVLKRIYITMNCFDIASLVKYIESLKIHTSIIQESYETVESATTRMSENQRHYPR